MADEKKLIQVESITAGLALLAVSYVFFKCRHTSKSIGEEHVAGSGQEQLRPKDSEKSRILVPNEQNEDGGTDRLKDKAEEEKQKQETKKKANDSMSALLIGVIGSIVGSFFMWIVEDIIELPLIGSGVLAVVYLLVLIGILFYMQNSILQYGDFKNLKKVLGICIAILITAALLLFALNAWLLKDTFKNRPQQLTVSGTIPVIVESLDSTGFKIRNDNLRRTYLRFDLQSSKSFSPKQEANTDSLHKKHNQKQK